MRINSFTLILFVFCLLTVGIYHEAHAQSLDQNYLLTRTYTSEDGIQYLDNIQYYDGIGRPIQNVQRKITPAGNDLVTLQEYDNLGRESHLWLPGTSSGNGAYVNPEAVKSASRMLNVDQTPYSRPVYETSPLNRVLEQYGPGTAWHTNSRSVQTDFFTNISGNDTLNCILYTVPDTSVSTDTLLTITRQGYYPTGSLYVTRTADEDGNASFEFSDHLGQILLTRQVVRNGSTKILYDTYYIYDDYGNKVAVVPPIAADAMKGNTTASWSNHSSTTLRDYAYLYKYDVYNRCKAKRLPGGDWMYYIYDTAGRLVFTQDGEQRRKSPNEWTFIISDLSGRSCLTGVCANSYNALATTPPLNGALVQAIRNNTTGAYKGYAILGVTLTSPVVLSVNYYDDYDFLGKNNIPANTDEQVKYTVESGYGTWYGENYTAANKLRNKSILTGTLTAQLLPNGTASGTYLYSVMYYDSKCRLVQAKSNNHLSGGTEKEYCAYNFTDQILQKKHVHAATGKATQTEVYTYTYDHAGRLVSVRHKLNMGSDIALAVNGYDELGRLKIIQRNGQAALRSTYTYNVRSWMKSITSTLFSQTLFYNDTYGGSTARYTGNISAMNWKLSNESQTRGYKFTYDNLSRLTSAGYLENGVANDHFNTSYTYDKHGNMTNLNRRGNTGTTTYGIIDNLTMIYSGNQLAKVEDTGVNVSLSASMDFKNGSNTVREYTYNRNGNLTKDANKGINSITYNVLNLPGTLTISNTSGSATNTYTYSADGEKLNTSISGKTTDYCGSVIYENGVLKRILIEGGYIESGIYYFYLTDHLGNNRVVANASGTIVQSNHFYPYGMSFTEGTQTSAQPFKFGNKELDTQKGLNWYDSQARMQDPVIPGFPTMDPLAEDYYSWSPYAYVMGNPMNAIDPDGRSTWVIRNADGTFRVVGGDLGDEDDNIYEICFNDGVMKKGESIGVTSSMTSFYNSDANDGKGAWATGSIIDPNDRSGQQFLEDFMQHPPEIGYYMDNAKTNQKYDFKATNGEGSRMENPEFYRGMPIGRRSDGTRIYSSARDIGNIAAGYIAGVNGVPWSMARKQFDKLQSKQDGYKSTEGISSQNAQYLGWKKGIPKGFYSPEPLSPLTGPISRVWKYLFNKTNKK